MATAKTKKPEKATKDIGVSSEELKINLEKYFGFNKFKFPQEDIIKRDRKSVV